MGGEPKGAVSSSVQIDYNSEYSVAHQLRSVLKENAVRVVDLFREWDEDGDGTISRREFAKVMPVLGIKVSKQDMDELFALFDPDGSGLIDYSELNELLRQPVGDPIKLAFSPWVARQVGRTACRLHPAPRLALWSQAPSPHRYLHTHTPHRYFHTPTPPRHTPAPAPGGEAR